MSNILHEPSKYDLEESQMAKYLAWLKKEGHPTFKDYAELHRWSVEQSETFWETIWDWSKIVSHSPYEKVLSGPDMPGAKWFDGATLNFAENLLRFALNGDSKRIAISGVSESRSETKISYGELLEYVNAIATFLRDEGVKVGDRVVGIVANTEEAIVAMLATTSIGAIWSSCSPDFGVQGIFDRFGQIQPKVLFSVNGYRYNGKEYDCMDRVQEIKKRVSSIKRIVIINYLRKDLGELSEETLLWDDVLCQGHPGEFRFEVLPFDHPAYILYTSGTTGLPKCIVHGAGGIILQHSKELMLHTDVQEGDAFFYFTTCGWMMWNWLVSGLMLGAELKLFDGAPTHPEMMRLWDYAEEEKISIFGTSAKFVGACRSAGLSPKSKHTFKNMKAVLSTGSPLLPEDYDWLYEHVKKDIRVSSISGGTDIVSCFVLGNPMLPVYRGEIQCKGLGMDVAAFNEEGKEVIGEQGELVCRKPVPSMPVKFWNDPDHKRYKKAYFERFPNIWCHGDFVEFNDRGGCMIYGRSDATLNPGGVRIGTAEIYRQVETLNEIKDSLVVGQDWEGDQRVILFVVLNEGVELNPELEKNIKQRIRKETTPRHVPSKIIAIKDIPYTISGKKVELAVVKILKGQSIENRDALANPDSLDQFQNLSDLNT